MCVVTVAAMGCGLPQRGVPWYVARTAVCIHTPPARVVSEVRASISPERVSPPPTSQGLNPTVLGAILGREELGLPVAGASPSQIRYGVCLGDGEYFVPRAPYMPLPVFSALVNEGLTQGGVVYIGFDGGEVSLAAHSQARFVEIEVTSGMPSTPSYNQSRAIVDLRRIPRAFDPSTPLALDSIRWEMRVIPEFSGVGR